MKSLIVVISGGVLIVLLTRLITPYGGMYMMHNFSLYNNITVYVLGIVILVVVIYFLMILNKKSNSGAITILDKRLADGEISIEEYENIRRVLKGSGN
jgi:uncharacterized membrane protein